VADPRHTLGTAGEAAVAAWYEAGGYEVLDRNWRCAAGELDLVVARGRTIVFCEVKTRRSDAFGTPAEAVTARKQQRLRRLALHWIGERGVHGDLRFDVASVRPGRGALSVEVLQAAF
jgi:putative endonuclease